ncbi:MAG: MG2 domain-containing protein [Gemmatimonadota bacterium]|nr:MG2 domain-containing protein [Gemmatimonadota bacterium]
MLAPRILAVLAVAVLTAEPPPALQILASSPSGEASATAPIQVTFDRPVAGSLDRSIDPARIFRIAPSVPGRLEWRDPVTLRFRPARPLSAGQSYTVTIANSFTAMDGRRLATPFSYSFSVTGPTLLTGLPANENEPPRFLQPDATFDLLYSSAVGQRDWIALAYLDLAESCGRPARVALKVVGQRPISGNDPWQYGQAGGYDRDHDADSLRRVLTLAPEKPLPLNCHGALVAQTVVDPENTRPFVRWGFDTYGPFRFESADCSGEGNCPTGGVQLSFTTPVKGADIQRHLTLLPAAVFTVPDTTEESNSWYLETQLTPHTAYAVIADTGLRDIFGQKLQGNNAGGFRTTGYAPLVEHEYGRLTVERAAFRTLAVKHVNVDTLTVTIAPVPDALIPAALQYSRWNQDDSALALITRLGVSRTVAVSGARDRVRIYGAKLPLYNAQRTGSPVLQFVRVTSPSLSQEWQANQPWAIVQVTDLAVHGKIGIGDGVVWVTGVNDGKPRAGALVTLYDMEGKVRARGRTDAQGLALLTGFRPDTSSEYSHNGLEGYLIAALGNDRALTSISEYDADLSPWRFNARSAYGSDRFPLAAAVFTERGIYRPGEPLYAKAIVRSGTLGALTVPARGDSLKWIFAGRDGGSLKETTVALSSFGTSDQRFTLPADLPLGSYDVRLQQRRNAAWIDIAQTSYRVAEYRPPEFLVEASTDSGTRFPGDSISARVEARYLFGAPMARAEVTWIARQTSLDFWSLDIPGTEGFYLGENGWWWEEERGGNETQVLDQGSDTLDAQGRITLRSALAAPVKGRPARATIEAGVIDVNRQAAGASASVIVHPASFYIGGKPQGESYFWTAGKAASVGIIAVRPDGRRVAGVKVRGTIVRKEWHRVHRSRAGYSEVYGEWVSDTVGRCDVVSGATPSDCRFTPPSGGTYELTFTAADEAGRLVSTSLSRWATGSDWVPWNDESQFKMDLIPDRSRYSVGDTATVLVASPFTDAEAWITIEREGLIEQRRMRLTSGSTTLKFPVKESWAPNVFVSVMVTRGRSAPPGALDDPGRPTIRVGYTELRVTPEVKRLTVTVAPQLREYRPGDTARVRVALTDVAGKAQRGEVTLWAVDEGVLALTGYQTPDPIDLLYAPRGLGLRLASNLTNVAPQVPEGEKGARAPGGGGGRGDSDILRSRFKTTAFFLGSVVTDSNGVATAKSKLPDNLTTFRIMAVAVTANDRYGKGQSPMLVTRPLVARPALPRFLREGDSYRAGVVVNQRAGGTPEVQVQAEATGSDLTSVASQKTTLEAGRGREVRFDFRQPGNGPLGQADSATFRFRVSGAGDADAVQSRLAIKPAYRPRAWTVSGVLTDTATADMLLPDGLDPERSRLVLTAGSSPLSYIKGLAWQLRVYPYYCTEQASSAVLPIIALYQAQKSLKRVTLLPGTPKREIETAVGLLTRRQRPDGGIGYWDSQDWTTPWLSAYAGHALLEAKSAGIVVNDSVLARLADYLRTQLNDPAPIRAPVVSWYESVEGRLADQVAAADFLSRYGKPEIAAENELLRNAAQLAWEDRVRLAEVLARRKAFRSARTLLQPAWKSVTVEGRRATMPEAALHRTHYFESRVRPIARLLSATLAVDSANALIGPLVETLVQQGRAGVLSPWNTQDYASAVAALTAFDKRMRAGAGRAFTVQSGGRTLFTVPEVPALSARLTIRDSSTALSGLLAKAGDGRTRLRLALAAEGTGAPIYYYLTVTEVPQQRPVNPEDRGIRVERWYERYDTDSPIVSAAEGELVRVRLRVTVPVDREFVVIDDALPAGLEAVDLSLRTASLVPGPGRDQVQSFLTPESAESEESSGTGDKWYYGRWDSGWWTPFDHKEIRDDRVVYSATVLWQGTYSMTYLARATTPGVFIRPPVHAEEMYNPAVYGRSDGGVFTVERK